MPFPSNDFFPVVFLSNLVLRVLSLPPPPPPESNPNYPKELPEILTLSHWTARPRATLKRLIKMATATCAIPIVDFSAMSLQNANLPDNNSPAIKTLADQLYRAFSTIGFVYLKNHGIPQEEVSLLLNNRKWYPFIRIKKKNKPKKKKIIIMLSAGFDVLPLNYA